jgi:hypothetical protein
MAFVTSYSRYLALVRLVNRAKYLAHQLVLIKGCKNEKRREAAEKAIANRAAWEQAGAQLRGARERAVALGVDEDRIEEELARVRALAEAECDEAMRRTKK